MVRWSWKERSKQLVAVSPWFSSGLGECILELGVVLIVVLVKGVLVNEVVGTLVEKLVGTLVVDWTVDVVDSKVVDSVVVLDAVDPPVTEAGTLLAVVEDGGAVAPPTSWN